MECLYKKWHLAILKNQIDQKITICELHEAGCLHTPSPSAAQCMVIITGLRRNSVFKMFLLWWEYPLTSPPLLSFPLSPH